MPLLFLPSLTWNHLSLNNPENPHRVYLCRESGWHGGCSAPRRAVTLQLPWPGGVTSPLPQPPRGLVALCRIPGHSEDEFTGNLSGSMKTYNDKALYILPGLQGTPQTFLQSPLLNLSHASRLHPIYTFHFAIVKYLVIFKILFGSNKISSTADWTLQRYRQSWAALALDRKVQETFRVSPAQTSRRDQNYFSAIQPHEQHQEEWSERGTSPRNSTLQNNLSRFL